MTVRITVAAIVLVAAPLLGATQEPPKLSCIKDVTYSQEFLTRYPKAGAACREVVVKDGKKWVRFDADVVKVNKSQVTANFMDNYRQSIATLTFKASPQAQVVVDGKESKFSSLRKGDTLSFWVPESRMGFYAAPGASESRKLALVDDTTKLR
jgi:hypothetical protein